MKFKALIICSALILPVAFFGCGGDDSGPGASESSLQSAVNGNTEPVGEFTSTDQLGSAVEGLFNSNGLQSLVDDSFTGQVRADVNLRNAFSITRNQAPLSPLFEQSGNYEECYSISDTQIVWNYDCFSEASGEDFGSGTLTISISGNFDEQTYECVGECYSSIQYDNVVFPDETTANGIIALWTDGTYEALYIEGTFGDEVFEGFIVVVNATTGELVGVVIEDEEGNVFLVSEISCTPENNPTQCTFTVTDETDDIPVTCTESSGQISCEITE